MQISDQQQRKVRRKTISGVVRIGEKKREDSKGSQGYQYHSAGKPSRPTFCDIVLVIHCLVHNSLRELPLRVCHIRTADYPDPVNAKNTLLSITNLTKVSSKINRTPFAWVVHSGTENRRGIGVETKNCPVKRAQVDHNF